MFSDELAIRYPASRQGEGFSVFVPKDKVQGALDEVGKVQVRFFHDKGTAWAVLPSDTQAIIPVKEEDLVAL
jgi:hypothetical protein